MNKDREMTEQNGKIVIRVDHDIADLIPGFLDNRRKDVVKIADALSRGDFEVPRILGHSMKGAGGGYGFDAITEIGAAIEAAAKAADPGSIREQVGKLETYLNSVEVVYE